MQEIKAKVTGSIDIVIRALNKKVDLNQPFYAINWFATKAEWLYHFYNFLANKSVQKIGGEAFFKGKVTETVLDEYNGDRNIILIVRYPNGHKFMNLFESLYFKLVSVLRILAVKNFTFGLTHKQNFNDQSKLEDKLHHVLHHFKSKELDTELFAEVNRLLNNKVAVKYSGSMVAELITLEKNEPEAPIESIMDGLIILESESKEELEKVIHSETYKKIIERLDASYIGFLQRIL